MVDASEKPTPGVLILDVGGPDNNDGLSLLRSFMEGRFVTGDKKGFAISKKRIVDDVGFDLDIVSTVRRAERFAERYPPESDIYMGDCVFDHYVTAKVSPTPTKTPRCLSRLLRSASVATAP